MGEKHTGPTSIPEQTLHSHPLLFLLLSLPHLHLALLFQIHFLLVDGLPPLLLFLFVCLDLFFFFGRLRLAA